MRYALMLHPVGQRPPAQQDQQRHREHQQSEAELPGLRQHGKSQVASPDPMFCMPPTSAPAAPAR